MWLALENSLQYRTQSLSSILEIGTLNWFCLVLSKIITTWSLRNHFQSSPVSRCPSRLTSPHLTPPTSWWRRLVTFRSSVCFWSRHFDFIQKKKEPGGDFSRSYIPCILFINSMKLSTSLSPWDFLGLSTKTGIETDVEPSLLMYCT